MNDITNRAPDGTFLPGKSGNPKGRPKGTKDQIVTIKHDLELAVRENIDPKKIQNIVAKLVEKAEGGNLRAAKLILDKVLPNAVDVEETKSGEGGFMFVVKNATIEVTKADDEPIDVTPATEETQNG